MTRLPIALSTVLAALLGLSLLAACDKPDPDHCRKALLNMQHILGTENLLTTGGLESEVRRCRSGSSKEAVECAIKATTTDDLTRCNFYKVGDKAKTPWGSAAGSAGPAAGSAGSAK